MNTAPRYTDEVLMAYVDHELDAAASRQIEAAMSADNELAARVARQRALRGVLHGAFDAVLDEPVPERLQSVLRGDTAVEAPGKVVAITAAPRRRMPLFDSRWGQWGMLAASLMLGVWLGRSQFAAPSDAMWARAEDGRLVAQAELAQALTSQLASQQPGDARVRVGVSFVARSGDYCRSFTLPAGLAGLACKPGTGGDWQLPLLVQQGAGEAGAGAQGAYRQAASSTTPAAVLRAIDDQIDGAPLDAAGERDAVQRGWQRAR
jgi:hypothetical protein